MVKINVIIGSTRPGRFSDKPAQWISELLKAQPDVEAELLDLRDYPMPFFNEPVSPSMMRGQYPDPAVQKWQAKIKPADGFIIVTPEYNHGYPAVLKNAFDQIYIEWNQKAIGFVSYGTVMGARSVEQLRQVSIELQMAPIREGVHMPYSVVMESQAEPAPALKGLFQPYEEKAKVFLDQLLWWTIALKTAREQQK